MRDKLRDLFSRKIIRHVRVFDYINHNLVEEKRVNSLSDNALNKIYPFYQVRFDQNGHWFNVDFWILNNYLTIKLVCGIMVTESEEEIMYKEIQLCDIENNPSKVNSIISDNAIALSNDLYILSVGNKDAFKFDEYTIYALKRLSKRINESFT